MKFQISVYNKKALLGGIITAIMTGFGILLIGNISQYEAKKLIQSSLPGVNMLCNTVVLASATILALLLTLLGISSGSKSKLKKTHYRQVSLIAKYDASLFIVAIIIFQVTNIPITEAENFPHEWYRNLYWVTLFLSSFLTGSIVAVILMLYSTIQNIIDIIGLKVKDHPLIMVDEDKEQEE